MILAVAAISQGLVVSGLLSGIIVVIGLTVINTLVTSLLGIDDDDFYYRNVIKRQARRSGGAIETDVPGVLFLEVDGLAHAVVSRAIRDGNAPTLARWLREGSHRLIGWETDWSSQTGACQAGLLHGSNDNLPAFRWWEKDRNAFLVPNHPRDAMEIERRVSNGRGLLAADGASRANLLSGDAPHSLLTMSTVLRRDRPGRIGQDYFAYFANPYNVARTLVLFVGEVISEWWSAAQQRRRDVKPRVHRSFPYPLVRAWTTVIQRDLQVQALIGDLYAGRAVVYTTFLGYDEVAHHSGVERPDTLATLREIDRQVARIEAAAKDAPRPYHLVVLADHGQTQGATFRDRYGTTLEQLVEKACAAESVESATQGDEAVGYLSASLTEASRGDNALARTVRLATERRTVDGAVVIGKEEREEVRREKDREAPPELIVMASGCLGLISFPREPGRVTLERIHERYPHLISTLREHPGIGFLLARSEQYGASVIGAQGLNSLDEDRVEGEDPLAPFGPNAARHVKRTDGFPNCADIMVNSTYWPETGEAAAFEELVGSHGGLGGPQSYPFVLVPRDWALPKEPIIGAEAMHLQMRRWLADLGHEAYRDGG
jgi:type I phosphodiesterase/nucleotide pyrophosphatase